MEAQKMKESSLEDWRKEGAEKFGEDPRNWKFICPACGHIASGQDFLDAGADINDSYQECIGRHTGKSAPRKGDSSGCNWAAYGLFGTLSKGRIVITEDGKRVEVFRFAEEAAS